MAVHRYPNPSDGLEASTQGHDLFIKIVVDPCLPRIDTEVHGWDTRSLIPDIVVVLKMLFIGFKHQRCGPYQPRPAALVLRTKKKKPYLIPPIARPQDLLVLGPSDGGMVIVYFLLAYAYLGRCPRLVWVGPLALKPDHIPSHPLESGMSHKKGPEISPGPFSNLSPSLMGLISCLFASRSAI